MIQFIIYAISGFCVVWLNLLLWGFTGGPVNYIPYFALIGGLLLFIVSAPIAIFLPRIAAGLALIGSALVIPWPLLILFQESDWSGVAICGVPPVVAATTAGFKLWRTRSQHWFTGRESPHFILRVAIALTPVIAFVSYFNAPLVIKLVTGFSDENPPIRYIIPDDFRGEIRIERSAGGIDVPLKDGYLTIAIPNNGKVRIKQPDLFSRWHKEVALSPSGRELPFFPSYREQPDAIGMRTLGMFNDPANNLPPETMVYVFGTWADANNVLEKFHTNFLKATPAPITTP
jgi:hypothetical protein